jgi:site-specific recombinase XerD
MINTRFSLGGILMLAEVNRFIDWVRMRSPQARTWRDYKCDLAQFTNAMASREPETIRPKDLDHFVQLQINKGFKPNTVNRRLAAVTSFYTFLNTDLNTEGHHTSCPVLPKRHYLQEPQRLPRPVNEPELRKFFGAVHDPRDRAMFSIMLRCGLRIGEVAELKMQDLYLGQSPAHMIIHGKGARERTVYLSPEAERDLQAWLAVRPRIRCEHVFVSYQHKKLSTTSISVRINHARIRSGVDLTAHRLRHTFADRLLSTGMPITSIQKLMGHRYVETTQNYAIANDKQVEADFYAASEKLDGWKLLRQATETNDLEADESIDVDARSTEGHISSNEAKEFIYSEIPKHASRLPGDLLHQLEAYCKLKANRWRPERVKANSLHFYSQHTIMWSFFSINCMMKTVQDLRLEHIMQYIKDRLDAGYAASTINNHLSSLRSFLSFLREDGLEIHPSLENIQRLKQAERLPRYLSSEQVRRLREAIEGAVTSPENKLENYDVLLIRAVFYLLWQGGLRVGEVEELHFFDFYISPENRAKRLFIRDSKWRKGRAVYLTDVSLEALRAYLTARGVNNADGYVFVRDGLPLKKNFLCSRLKRFGKQVDVDISPHRLRHTFATQLLNVGCAVTSIQKLLGHTNLNTTMTYARAFDQTVMLDYFRAVDVIEAHPGGLWFGMNNDTSDSGH